MIIEGIKEESPTEKLPEKQRLSEFKASHSHPPASWPQSEESFTRSLSGPLSRSQKNPRICGWCPVPNKIQLRYLSTSLCADFPHLCVETHPRGACITYCFQAGTPGSRDLLRAWRFPSVTQSASCCGAHQLSMCLCWLELAVLSAPGGGPG